MIGLVCTLAIAIAFSAVTASSHAGEADVAFGLEHQPIGEASIDYTSDQITITDFGSTGEDGVAITLGDASGWVGALDFGEAGALSAAMSVSVASNFTVDDLPGSAQLTISETDDGLASILLDDTGCACAVTVELLFHGAVVDSIELDRAPFGEIAVGAVGSIGNAHVRIRSERNADSALVISNPVASLITLTGSTPVEADTILVRPAEDIDDIVSSHSISITATNLDSLTIHDEALVQFANDHRVTGTYLMQGMIDEDGEPDVSVWSGEVAPSELHITPDVDFEEPIEAVDLRLRFPYVFAFAKYTDVLMEDGSTEQLGYSWFFMGSCGCAFAYYVEEPRFVKVPSQVEQHVTARLGGETVGTSNPPGGPLWYSALEDIPDTFTFELLPSAPGMIVYREVWRWDEPTDATLGGLDFRDVIVDEMEVVVEIEAGSAGLPVSIVESRLTSESFAPGSALFTIDDEVFRGFDALCPADLDGSGEVGFADLLFVLGAWGPCSDCAADLDGSGDVGFADLLQLLGAWGPCD